jgi:putative hydrolases of HD superfamily
MKRKSRQKNNETKVLLDFIAEAGLLKRVKRSGWWVLGIEGGESVADHSFRCAVIGYILAKMEGADPYKVLLMTLFNDIHEARISDLHKMAQRYINGKESEDKALAEQIAPLPSAVKNDLAEATKAYRTQTCRESIVARDADILECLIQAKEYEEYGFKEAHKFMFKAPRFLKSKSARKLWALAQAKPLNEWWMRLSGFER